MGARILPIAVNFLVERRIVDAKKAMPLIGFRADWDFASLLKAAFESCTSQAEKKFIAEFCYRYIQMTEHSGEVWRRLKHVLEEQQVIIRDVRKRLELEERKEHAQQENEKRNELRASRRWKENTKLDWNAIFQELNLAVANNLSLAHQRFRNAKGPFNQKEFFEEAVRRVAVGREAEFVTVLAEAPEFNLYHLRCFLKLVPAEWKARLAVKSALVSTLRSFCRRYCMEIVRGRYYEICRSRLHANLQKFRKVT